MNRFKTFAESLRIYLPIPLACVIFSSVFSPPICLGQDTTPDDRRKIHWSSDFHNSYYTFHPETPRALDLQRHMLRNSLSPPVEPLRFLSNETVRKELGVSLKDSKRLPSLIDRLNDFELQTRWDATSRVDEVASNAKAKIREFDSDLDDFYFDSKFYLHFEPRLIQLRRQFSVVGEEPYAGLDSIYGKVDRELELTDSQQQRIEALVDEELTELLSNAAILKSLEDILEPSNFEKLKHVTNNMLDRPVSTSVAIAQCLPLFKPSKASGSQEVEDEQRERWLIEPLVLTSGGQWATQDQYLERGSIASVFRKWKDMLRLFESGALDWLELTPEQVDSLSALKIRTMKENGIPTTTYFGHEELSKIRLAPNPTIKDYEEFCSDYKEALAAADKRLGEQIEENIILPHQLEQIMTVLAANRLQDLGLMHLVLEEHFGIDLSSDEREKVEQLQSQRLNKLQQKFKSLERRCLKVLDETQREFFQDTFGNWAAIYPSFWVSFSQRVEPNQSSKVEK